jgi:Zn finger protein HypA/HybF involved in hydrogenase expression
MSDLTARGKFSCPSCGGEAQWNPAKRALVCPYCGTESPAEWNEATGEIAEHCLATAMRNLGDNHRGWAAEKVSVKCQSCQAISVFDSSRVAQRCDFCGSSAMIPIEQQTRPIRPESLLEFKVPERQVRDLVRQWYGTRWFAPNKLKSRALTDTVHGIYIPYWTFDAHAYADWSAMSGDYYYETESYTDAQGRQSSRQVRKVRWYPSHGSLDHFFDDELIPASRGVHAGLLRKVEPFPTQSELKPYNPGFLSGWVVEQYQIDLVAAAEKARRQMDEKLRALCARQVPGDTHRDLRVEADYRHQTFKHVLVPVWLISYDYGSKSYQIVVNGYTGRIAGEHPLSWIKIMLLVLFILAVVVLIASHAGS